ncbi:MAG: HlyD family secretion protein [Aridibacter sp.]
MAVSRKGKIIIGISLLAVLTVAIIAGVFATRSDSPEVTIVTTKKQAELRSTVTAPGEIRPIQFINLSSEVQGRIEEIYVKEGDVVEKGQQLVRLDPNQLQSNTDAQIAALDAARDDVQGSRSQVTAAQNQYSQSQQGLIAQEAAINTAQQQVASAEESVNQARQQTVASQTEVDRNKVEVNAARRELKRTEELLESGVASRLEYDQAKDRLDTAQANLNNAQARLNVQNSAIKTAQNSVKEAKARVAEARARSNQQEVAVKDAKRAVSTADYSANASQSRANQQAAVLRGSRNQRDKTLQVAPIAGVIADIPTKVGTFAVAGLSTTPLLTIADMTTVNIEVKVNETEIDKVEVGQAAIIKVDAFGDEEIKGEVTQKTPLAVGSSQTSGGLSSTINTQEAKEFRVVIELVDVPDTIKNGLRPGMSATAEITTDVKKDVVAVPIQAVIEKKPDVATESDENTNTPKPKKDKDETVKGVFVLDGNRVKFVQVTTGITGESDIQITSGLEAGQQVITGPSRILNTLKEGDVVKKQLKTEGEKEKS